MQKVWLDCKCSYPSHSIQVVFDRGQAAGPNQQPEDPEIYVTTFLVPHASFWARLKSAFNYLFKRKAVLLAETILETDDVDKLGKLVVTYRLLKKIRTAKQKKDSSQE